VPVCHYEQANDWWISKMIKKHKSTVLSLAWCCNNKFVITGGCDYKARVFSAFMPGIDPEEDDGFGEIWKDQHKFGEVLAEFDMAQSWVQSVSWSPNGFRLAFTEHGSKVHFVQILAGSPPLTQTLNWKGLPFLSIQFLTDNTVAAVGYDYNPVLFTVVGGSEAEPKWGFQETFEKAAKAGDVKAAPAGGASSSAAGAKGGAFAQSRALFANATDRGVQATSTSKTQDAKSAASAANSAAITTRHTNAIVSLAAVPGSDGVVSKVWSTSLDGRVLLWDLAKLKITIK